MSSKAVTTEDSQNIIGASIQKLLPVEVTGAYITLRGVFSNSKLPTFEDLYLLALFTLALAIAAFFVLATRAFGVTSILHRFFYCGCFVLWAIGIEINTIAYLYENYPVLPKIISATIIIVSFAVPFYLTPLVAKP